MSTHILMRLIAYTSQKDRLCVCLVMVSGNTVSADCVASGLQGLMINDHLNKYSPCSVLFPVTINSKQTNLLANDTASASVCAFGRGSNTLPSRNIVICAFTMKPHFNWPCTNKVCYILVMHNKPLTYTLCSCMITLRGAHDHWPIKPYLYCTGCSYPVYDSVSSNKCLEANLTIYPGF